MTCTVRHHNGTAVLAALLLVLFGPFCHATEPVSLSIAEAAHLQEMKTLKLCVDPDYLPFEHIDSNGHYVGIGAGFMARFAESLGISFELQITQHWQDSLRLAEIGGCDVVAMLNDSPERSRYLNFTDPYLEGDVVILTRSDIGYLGGINALRGKTVAMPRGWRVTELLQQDYPDINLQLVDNLADALQHVADGTAYATLETLRSALWQQQVSGLDNVKVSGQTPYSNSFRVGIRKDDPLLLSAFNKAVNHMPIVMRNDLIERGFQLPVERGIDRQRLWQILAVLLVLVGFLLWRQRTLQAFAATLTEKNQELERLSERDHLTGACNRLKLDRELAREIERAQRYHRPLALILYDLDHFKRINDRFGHPFGDAVLCATVTLAQRLVRQQDCLGRWGGEEFLILCPETNRLQALVLAEKIRAALAALRVHEPITITASFGVAELAPGQTLAQLIQQADKAMYAAKQEGRNCVVGAPDAEPLP